MCRDYIFPRQFQLHNNHYGAGDKCTLKGQGKLFTSCQQFFITELPNETFLYICKKNYGTFDETLENRLHLLEILINS